MSYLEELLPEFRKGAKISKHSWAKVLGKDCYYRLENNKLIYFSGITEREQKEEFSIKECLADDWFIIKEPEPDWDYIIKNKCLCWFWDDDESEKTVSILINAEKDEYTPFLLYDECYFEHCRPVRRDEVTFYEDKKDE